MQYRTRHHDIVLTLGIVGVDRERILRTREANIRGAEHAVLAGKTIAEIPLLPDDLDLRRSGRHGDELAPHQQARREHGGYADRGHDREPPFELLILRFVVRPEALAMQ